jgi:hypothetical protein
MGKQVSRKVLRATRPKTKLGLPDLDQSKRAVLDSLRSPESKRGYRHAIDASRSPRMPEAVGVVVSPEEWRSHRQRRSRLRNVVTLPVGDVHSRTPNAWWPRAHHAELEAFYFSNE